MKILYYDCFSGISGDMNLGALIDVGVDREYLVKQLDKLHIDGYNISIEKGEKNGICGTKVDIILLEKGNGHNHHHRNLSDVEKIIYSSELSDNIKNISLEIFKIVAKAESKVHNKPVDEVHFHEVGAVDSIIDIVGAAICFDYLKIDKVMASTVEIGYGLVKCAHGILPVPAPATADILKGIPVKSQVPFEATTPTGAAILSYFVSEFTNFENFRIKNIGYGIGDGNNENIPNVLRVFIGVDNSSSHGENDFIKDKIGIFECNIDDMNPENYGYIMDEVMQKGALDVYLTPIIMKKGRPSVKLSVLYMINDEDIIRDFIVRNTTTLGIRKYIVDRDTLKRDFGKVSTIYGEVTVKSCYYKGKKLRSKPEYEDCKKLALKNNVGIWDVQQEAIKNTIHFN